MVDTYPRGFCELALVLLLGGVADLFFAGDGDLDLGRDSFSFFEGAGDFDLDLLFACSLGTLREALAVDVFD